MRKKKRFIILFSPLYIPRLNVASVCWAAASFSLGRHVRAQWTLPGPDRALPGEPALIARHRKRVFRVGGGTVPDGAVILQELLPEFNLAEKRAHWNFTWTSREVVTHNHVEVRRSYGTFRRSSSRRAISGPSRTPHTTRPRGATIWVEMQEQKAAQSRKQGTVCGVVGWPPRKIPISVRGCDLCTCHTTCDTTGPHEPCSGQLHGLAPGIRKAGDKD